jgi:signal transduction histidine kinase
VSRIPVFLRSVVPTDTECTPSYLDTMTTIASELMGVGLPTGTRILARHGRTLPRTVLAFLRVPLVLKLIGANVAIALATIAVALSSHGTTLADRRMVTLLVSALVVAQVVNSALVIIALRPLRLLEEASSRVLSGDMGARVRYSPLADRDVARTGRALNELLDELMRERDRVRRLARKVIGAQDAERARIARELHDTTAQTMAGVVLQLSVAERTCPDGALATTLHEIRETASEALEEVRTMSHVIYPRVLEDLGLRAALDWLARRTREASNVEIDVFLRGSGPIPAMAGSALFRVAQEALLNALRHSSATSVEVRLDVDPWYATLEVEDNGVGFDAADAETRRPGMGIFSMRERVALADGALSIDTAPGRGCCVRATVPLELPRP